MRALLLDENKLFVEVVRPMLEGIGVKVSNAGTVGQALGATEDEPIDIILLNLNVLNGSEFGITQKLSERYPEAVMVALTELTDPVAVRKAMKSGFRGYVAKDFPMQRFLQAIKAALDDRVVIPHAPASVAKLRTPAERHAELLASQLTPREREVLTLLAEGFNGRMIARRLSISLNTVRTHVQGILTKLQVHSRLEAATFAARNGLVDEISISSEGLKGGSMDILKTSYV